MIGLAKWRKSMKNNIRDYYASGLIKMARDGLADDVDSGELEFLSPRNLKEEGILLYTSGHPP